METKKLPLSQVYEHRDNPRIISDAKFQKLIDSILAFPKMLSLRPVVIDEQNNSLGGNMRLRGLKSIAMMQYDAIKERLNNIKGYTDKPDKERKQIRTFWREWLKHPTVETADASDLTDDERKQFMIKDNVNVGEWDWAELESWDASQLQEWGCIDMPDFASFIDNNGQGIVPNNRGWQKVYTNSELDVDGFGDKIKMVLLFSIGEHAYVQQKLSNDGETKEQALLRLLGYAEQ